MASGAFQMIEHGSGRNRFFRSIVNRRDSHQESRRIWERHDAEYPKILKHLIATIRQNLIENVADLAAKLAGFAVIRRIVRGEPTALLAPRSSLHERIHNLAIAIAVVAHPGENRGCFLLR